MDSNNFIDPYLDAETGILKNLVGAKRQEALSKAEGDLVFARFVQLQDLDIEPTRDLTEFQKIHQHLFQDVYSWAGELRTVDIRKNAEESQYFLPFQYIERAFAFSAQELAEENFLKELSRQEFMSRFVYHYDQINYIHPFREGNGRVQRVFWNRVAHEAGWHLDWTKTSGAENDLACQIATNEQNLEPLKQMVEKIVVVSDDLGPMGFSGQ